VYYFTPVKDKHLDILAPHLHFYYALFSAEAEVDFERRAATLAEAIAHA
jgi:hypothetical protein